MSPPVPSRSRWDSTCRAEPGALGEIDAWLLGTTFDIAKGVTGVNLLDAAHIANGPIAQATLPYWRPYGFHGNFTAA